MRHHPVKHREAERKKRISPYFSRLQKQKGVVTILSSSRNSLPGIDKVANKKREKKSVFGTTVEDVLMR